jgi:outer membrane lipoprotein LolB
VAADAQTLTRQFLGYPLPLEQLADWVRARDSGGEFESRDTIGRPLRLRRDGWRIDYDYGSSELSQALPERIIAERVEGGEGGEGGFELRLRIDEWSRLTTGEGP